MGATANRSFAFYSVVLLHRWFTRNHGYPGRGSVTEVETRDIGDTLSCRLESRAIYYFLSIRCMFAWDNGGARWIKSAERMQVPEHTELMWILSCTASVGYLSRMTQWKVCYDGAETWIGDRSILTDWPSAGQARPIGWGFGVRLYERKNKTQTGAFLLSRAAGCGYPAIWVYFLPSIPSQALSRSLFQRNSCSGRTGSSTTFGICETMRWSVQHCPWWDLYETTHPPMYVKPLIVFVSLVLF